MTTDTKVKLRPLADRVLVKRAKHEERTTGGIILPETNREKQEMGVVIAIGPGKTDKDGRRIEITVKAGDKIMWDKFAGSEVKIEDEDDFVIVKSDDIIAIVE